MFKNIAKLFYMARVGNRYIKQFKKSDVNPFMTPRAKALQLSQDRNDYSNNIVDYLNIDVEVHGTLPKENRILYAINHRSLLDILVMERIFSRGDKNGTWIAKQELFDNKIYGEFFQYSGCISVDLENRKGLLSFFKEIKKILKEIDDFNIFIFPEGERYKGDGVAKFQSGASKIAKSNKLDIVPIFIDEKLEEVFEEAPFSDKKIVKVYIGEKISHEKLEEEYREFINSI